MEGWLAIRGHIPPTLKQVLALCNARNRGQKSERTFVMKGVCFSVFKFLDDIAQYFGYKAWSHQRSFNNLLTSCNILAPDRIDLKMQSMCTFHCPLDVY